MSQMILDMQGKFKAKEIDQMMARELLCNLMIRRNLPFIFVKYVPVDTFILQQRFYSLHHKTTFKVN